MKLVILILLLVTASVCPIGFAKPAAESEAVNKDFVAPKNSTILIIRHAEKPNHGPDLSPAGEQRAKAYPAYFKTFEIDSKSIAFDAIYATADSKNSHRPRLTVEPLSRGLGLKIQDQFKDKDFAQLAAEISSKHHDKNVLVCWHHGEIPGLLAALGADPAMLLPGGKWPNDEFGWVLQLRYDENGRLIPGELRRIDEHLTLACPQ